MIVLDCESTDSIYGSVEAIAGAKRDAIESFLKSIDLESLYGGSSPPARPGNEFLSDAFMHKFSTDLSYDKTCWFHLTRVDEDSTFEEGILPLGQRLNHIFDWLYQLFQDVVTAEQWVDFKRRCPQKASGIYKMKTENRFHWGPYAILVRDHAFKPKEAGNHDYLSGPEIVEDICYCFEEIYHVNVLNIFLEKTKPCIVKFIHDGTKSKYLGAALRHLYAITRGEKCTDQCSDCLDVKGIVQKDQIRRIEFPKYVARKAQPALPSKPLMPVRIVAPDFNGVGQPEPGPKKPNERAEPK